MCDGTDTLKFVLVGEVDHGKSTVIGRLLYDTDSLSPEQKAVLEDGKGGEFAFLLDHLEEERMQRITIDTAQAFFKWKGRKYVIIDAPGHVEFIKNMITGASQADLAVLMVDASEGVRAQTKRHAYMISLIGIRDVIVVVNKMDLTGYDESSFCVVKDDIGRFLAELGINPVAHIPVSALHGDNVASKSDNMKWYEGMTFLEALGSFNVCGDICCDDDSFIFSVQDTYNFDGKMIVVGRVEAGILKEWDKFDILPGGGTSCVSKIEVYGKNIDTAFAGDSVGLIFSDKVFVERGDILKKGIELNFSDTVTGKIFWLDKDGCKEGDELLFRILTSEVNVKVDKVLEKVDVITLSKSQSRDIVHPDVAVVRFKLKKRIPFLKFTQVPSLGRFVLVRGDNVVAGGIMV